MNFDCIRRTPHRGSIGVTVALALAAACGSPAIEPTPAPTAAPADLPAGAADGQAMSRDQKPSMAVAVAGSERPWCESKCDAFLEAAKLDVDKPSCTSTPAAQTKACIASIDKWIAANGPQARWHWRLETAMGQLTPNACTTFCNREKAARWPKIPPPAEVSLDILVRDVALPRATLINFHKLYGWSKIGGASGYVTIHADGRREGRIVSTGTSEVGGGVVGPLRVDVTEATFRDYSACVKAGKCTPTPLSNPKQGCNRGDGDNADAPMNCVNLKQAREYCNFVGKRLPSSEEWAYLAYGADAAKSRWLVAQPEVKQCWQKDDNGRSEKSPCKVGTLPEDVTPRGVLDVIGGVTEWTEGLAGADNIICGGSWWPVVWQTERTTSFDGVGYRTSEFRYKAYANNPGVLAEHASDPGLGMRCVQSVEPAAGGPSKVKRP
ncbi:MAG: SUMF1/EgtB/PvdO family nonheme iron enzyme [Deltaproteobacteria bacterium]|nr:SUMF1/EgtB/PvdO family nonheme iron enzyme [Deltaproteobacteria bacterium]